MCFWGDNLTTLKNKSQSFPLSALNSNVNLFLKQVAQDVDALPLSTPSRPNLSHQLQQAFEKLISYSHLTIKPSDKGGNIVILNNDQYKQLCLDILDNPSWYKRVSMDIIDQYNNEFYSLVDKAYDSQIISKPLWKYNKVANPRVATFYCLSKTHKKTIKLSGRPIVSGIDSFTQNASILIDTALHPHVQSLPLYIKDTKFFKSYRTAPNPGRGFTYYCGR